MDTNCKRRVRSIPHNEVDQACCTREKRNSSPHRCTAEALDSCFGAATCAWDQVPVLHGIEGTPSTLLGEAAPDARTVHGSTSQLELASRGGYSATKGGYQAEIDPDYLNWLKVASRSQETQSVLLDAVRKLRLRPKISSVALSTDYIPPECRRLHEQVSSLETSIGYWQTQLQSGDYAGDKAYIVELITHAQETKAEVEAALAECLKEHPPGPRNEPPGIPPECESLAAEVDSLEGQIAALQESLKTAPQALKADLATQIHDLQKELAKKKQQLANCIDPQEPQLGLAELVPPPFENPCAEEAEAVNAAQTWLNHLGEQMDTAGPALKSVYAELIEEANHALADANQNYEHCWRINGGQPALGARFVGSLTLTETSNSNIPTPLSFNLDFGLVFEEAFHTEWSITDFTPASFTYQVPSLGTVTTTFSVESSAGTYDPANGSMSIIARVHVAHDADIVGDSDIVLEFLTSNPGGVRMQADGFVEMVAIDDVFDGGYLDGDTASMTLAGVITPHPYVAP